MVTAGGLIFTGTRDRKVRAFDVETGKVLWRSGGGRGAWKACRQSMKSAGREYIVFCASAQAGIDSGDAGQARFGSLHRVRVAVG